MNSTPVACFSRATMPLVLMDPAKLSPSERQERRTTLRNAHLAVGVDPAYLAMPEGVHLWFVSVVLDLEVHAGCQGFTRSLYEYAMAKTPEDAIDTVRRYFAEAIPHSYVISASAKLSSCEHPEELTFPEQVRRADMPVSPRPRTLTS